MVRWLCVVACMLLGGCFGDRPGEGPESPAAPLADGGVVDGGQGSAATTGDASTADPSLAPQSWYLHKVRDCAGDPCNCGSNRAYMDRLDSEGDCDGNGNRPFLESQEGFLVAESWPAAEPFAPWPAGSLLEGTLYLTTDVESSYDLFFVLATGSIELARTEVQRVTAREAGFGLTYTQVPFSATLDAAVPDGAKLRFELHLDFQATATSYFVGYEEDHVSSFSLRLPRSVS